MVVRKCNFLVGFLPALLSLSMCPTLALPLSFSSAENRHYAYTYDEVYSLVSIERIDEADEVKEERWKVISTSYHPFPFDHALSYPPSPLY